MRKLILLQMLGSVALLSACSFKPLDTDTVRVEVQVQKPLEDYSRLSDWFSPPANLPAIQCMGLNVIGSDIASSSASFASGKYPGSGMGVSRCSYPGVLAPLKYVGSLVAGVAQTLEVDVPKGQNRIFQVLGSSDGTAACGGVPSGWNPLPGGLELFQIGAATQDINGNASVSIASTYSGAYWERANCAPELAPHRFGSMGVWFNAERLRPLASAAVVNLGTTWPNDGAGGGSPQVLIGSTGFEPFDTNSGVAGANGFTNSSYFQGTGFSWNSDYGLTGFIVVKGAPNPYSVIFGFGGDGTFPAGQTFFTFTIGSGGNPEVRVQTPFPYTISKAATSAMSGAYSIYDFTIDYADTGSTAVNLYVNGTQDTGSAGGGPWASVTSVSYSGNVQIGAKPAGANPAAVTLGDVIIFNGLMPPDQRLGMRRALGLKYQVPLP